MITCSRSRIGGSISAGSSATSTPDPVRRRADRLQQLPDEPDAGRQKLPSGIQETDTISRTVYGFATAYLLTGGGPFLEAAEKGTHTSARDSAKRDRENEGSVYWLHALDWNRAARGRSSRRSSAMTIGADPVYEQIYALAGPIQTYRITGDPGIRADDKTINLFNQLLPRPSPSQGRLLLAHHAGHVRPQARSRWCHNQARKNWRPRRRPRACLPD